MKLRVGKRAQQQANKIEQWWVEHRPAALTLFMDELEQTFQHICRVRDAVFVGPHPVGRHYGES